MEISYRISWRRDFGEDYFCDSNAVEQKTVKRGEGFLGCQAGCSGSITPMSFICTDFSETENWSFGENQIVHTFTSVFSSTVRIGFSGGHWIPPIGGTSSLSTTYFFLDRQSSSGHINSSPRAVTFSCDSFTTWLQPHSANNGK